MISEEMLRSAAREAEEDIYGMEGKDRTFYRSLEGKLSRFYRRKHHPAAWRVLRSAAGLAVSVLVLSVLILTFHSEARAATLGWVKEQYHNMLRYTFPGAPTETPTLAYEPQWLPEGYVETERIAEGGYGKICYENGENERIVFVFEAPDASGTAEVAPASDEKHRTVTVSGQEADLFYRQVEISASADEESVFISSSLSWMSADGNTLFYLDSALHPDELIRIAESIPQDD